MAAPSTPTSAWVRRFHPEPEAATQVICFPHAGGSATFYFPVAQALSPAVDVLAIQYPGRQDRRVEPCIDDMDTLADLVSEELRPWLDRPFTLFGHSMGATLAFEVALRLERSGHTALGLFASGRRAPSRHRDEQVHLASDERLISEIKRLEGTESRVFEDEEIVRMILPAVRSDYRAAESYRYRPGPALSCPVTALTGDRDPHVTLDEAEAWREHTTGPFRLRVFPGGHFFLNSHAQAVMREITGLIDGSSE
ncbi:MULTISPECIES: thioesterase II family protein [unclassified Streptomyces]|uniref:thioesterase II family protein n=1 Tax=unclassified Streptomyces TaxID=2593676 RepID=UPI00070DA748|nr:alpha/beta fold hydrolase [Streptomyces sp. Root1310]KQX77120.1 oleoyl-ACP hydrolase [Streptomyces sp. Root1310]